MIAQKNIQPLPTQKKGRLLLLHRSFIYFNPGLFLNSVKFLETRTMTLYLFSHFTYASTFVCMSNSGWLYFFFLVKGNNSSEDVIHFKFRFWSSLLTKGVKNERENAYRLLFSRRLPLTRSQSTRALCWILCATCNGNCPSPSPWSHHTPQIESTKDGSAAAISVVFHLGKNEWYPVPNNSSESSGALNSRQNVSPV